MVLTDVEAGKMVRVLLMNSGHGLEGKLRQLGIHSGGTVQILRKAPFHGPVLLELDGREIALGYGIAKKIMVEGIE